MQTQRIAKYYDAGMNLEYTKNANDINKVLRGSKKPNRIIHIKWYEENQLIIEWRYDYIKNKMKRIKK